MSDNTKVTLAFLVGWVQAVGIYLIIKLNLDPAPETTILVLLAILCGFVLFRIKEAGET